MTSALFSVSVEPTALFRIKRKSAVTKMNGVNWTITFLNFSLHKVNDTSGNIARSATAPSFEKIASANKITEQAILVHERLSNLFP